MFFFTLHTLCSHNGNFPCEAVPQYHEIVARGWESKSVEEQQSQANLASAPPRPQLSAEQRAQESRREGLMLARCQVLAQLKAVSNPRRREMLERALADLQTQLAHLG